LVRDLPPAEVAFALNAGEEETVVDLPMGGRWTDLLTAERVAGKVGVPGMGFRYLKRGEG